MRRRTRGLVRGAKRRGRARGGARGRAAVMPPKIFFGSTGRSGTQFHPIKSRVLLVIRFWASKNFQPHHFTPLPNWPRVWYNSDCLKEDCRLASAGRPLEGLVRASTEAMSVRVLMGGCAKVERVTTNRTEFRESR